VLLFVKEFLGSLGYGFLLGSVVNFARALEPALPADSAEYANPCHFLDFGHAA